MFEQLPVYASCTLDIVDHFGRFQPAKHGDEAPENKCQLPYLAHMTLQEIADIYPGGAITRERVRQLIECKGNPYRKGSRGALRRLRYPGRSNVLRIFLESTTDLELMTANAT